MRKLAVSIYLLLAGLAVLVLGFPHDVLSTNNDQTEGALTGSVQPAPIAGAPASCS